MKNRIVALLSISVAISALISPSGVNAEGLRLSRPSNHMQTGGVDYQDELAQPSAPSAPATGQMQTATMDNTTLQSGTNQTGLRGGATDGGNLNNPLSASADLGNPRPRIITGGTRKLTSNELSNLSHHDVILLIDKSSSMAETDCPSMLYRNFMVSRWNWCREQTMDLAQQTANIFPQGISVLLFSMTTRIFPHVDVRAIPQIFADNHPETFTNEAPAISAALDDYFQRRAAARGKVAPLLVAIITDGRPTSETAVRRVIVEATHNMRSPDEIKITFLLIGQDQKGLEFIQEMDRGLVGEGAKFDIVTSRTFPELVRTGLVSALADCLSEPPASPLLDALNNLGGKHKNKNKL